MDMQVTTIQDVYKRQDIETTRKIVRNMMLKYQAEDRGIKIIELENAYQMCTKEEYYDYLVTVSYTHLRNREETG